MNECEQIHPLLRGYLSEELSARDRRLVARHLNLCALARKEMDRLRSGPLRSPANPVEPPSEPWDLRILRWLFNAPGQRPAPTPKARARNRVPLLPEKASRPSPWRPVLGVLTFFIVLGLATHLIQNADHSPFLQGAKHWLARAGFPGMKPSLEMVQDLTTLPSWTGPSVRAVGPYRGMIRGQEEFDLYWRILNPTTPRPEIDLQENALALVLTENGFDGGLQPRFLRAENYTDRTVLWFDETPVKAVPGVAVYRSWVLQVVPKPAKGPVLIQKVP